MQYPLKEKIGSPDLLVGRERMFRQFHKWIANIPRELSKSRVILARRKSGKTAFVQRLFNELWSANGEIVPFYYSVPEHKVWLGHFALEYYVTFASHYISFLTRDPGPIRELLSLDQIRTFGEQNNIPSFVKDIDSMREQLADGHDGLMWFTAQRAPHSFAGVYGRPVLVIIDEFQYLTNHIYRTPDCRGEPDETMPGSYHSLSESKIAPMLVTGSYVSWLLKISMEYLEAGRLSKVRMSPQLTEEEGLQAVYKYAEVYREPITHETAALINRLCMSDPFFISCVMQSLYPERELDTPEGVIDTVNYEITDYESEMTETWGEYINATIPKINDVHTKHILLYLSKHNDRDWTPAEIKQDLQFDISDMDILKRLELMFEADLLDRGRSDIQFRGLQDGTLNLILRRRFEKQIKGYVPSFKAEFNTELTQLRRDKKRLQGQVNQLNGQMAEYLLATKFRSIQRFALSDYFAGVRDTTVLTMQDVRHRVIFQRDDGKSFELDVVAKSTSGHHVIVEVKRWQQPIGLTVVTGFEAKLTAYRAAHPNVPVLPAILALGGFTAEAKAACAQHQIGMAQEMAWLE